MSKTMSRPKLAVLLSLLVLGACGGSGEGTPAAPAAPAAKAEGVYGGTITGGSSPAFQLLILENDEYWEMETGLSAKEQATAREVLRGLALLDDQRMGIPARLHFRLNVDELGLRPALPPCIRHLPFFIAGERHGWPVVRACAPQRGAKCMALPDFSTPPPAFAPPGADVADDSLGTGLHVDVLHRDRLVAPCDRPAICSFRSY